MKNILVLICLFAFVSTQAQIKEYNGSAADTIGTVGTFSHTFTTVGTAYKSIIEIRLDTVSSVGSQSIISQYSYDNVNFTPIDTVAYGVTVDSSMSLVNTSDSYAPYLRVHIKGTSGISVVDKIVLRIIK
jgi:hypothetical protein